jgi:hypothetical protein
VTTRPPKRTYQAIELGPLPVDMINATLGTELEPGLVRLSRTAHKHVAKDHADDYLVCMPALPQAIAAPTFIGQDPTHRSNFVLVKRVGLADGRAVLVAIGLEVDRNGFYAVRTSYLVPQKTIDVRRAARRLMIPRPGQTKGPA